MDGRWETGIGSDVLAGKAAPAPAAMVSSVAIAATEVIWTRMNFIVTENGYVSTGLIFWRILNLLMLPAQRGKLEGGNTMWSYNQKGSIINSK